MDPYQFGYPRHCIKCESFSQVALKLPLPYYNGITHTKKIMLIGQDPYIFSKPERVEFVLMLNEDKGQLRGWLSDFLGKDIFGQVELYATNVVKCPVKRGASISQKRVLNTLKPFFNNCKDYLIKEIIQFKPTLVLTFGEPAHRLFTTILSNQRDFGVSMHEAFTGEFIEAKIGNVFFKYSPCLHIKTFRVADTYGERVKAFKTRLAQEINIII